MRRSLRRSIFCFLVTYLGIQLMLGGTHAQVPDDIRARLTGRGHALLIGVSHYDADAWPSLPSIITDIQDLAQGLAPHFATVETLVDPTADAIHSRLRDFMVGEWNKPDERLLVYYAGHGFTDFNPYRRDYTGYITGKDTPACRGADCGNASGRAIPFSEFDALNREVRTRHVIMLFDSCFSGTVFQTRASSSLEPNHYDYIRARDAIHSPARYYITAGGANEKIPADSQFAQLVLRGLRGEADIYKNGFITGEELGVYIQRKLPVYAGVSLHPQKGPILDARLSTGEFVFLTGLKPPVMSLTDLLSLTNLLENKNITPEQRKDLMDALEKTIHALQEQL